MGAEHSTEWHSNRQRGMPAYSRHTGKNMGSHTHYKGDRIGHPSSNLIGRTRVTKVSESYSVYFYMRWNLDTMKGQRTSKICSLRRGFVVMRFFSINYTITGARKIVASKASLYRSSFSTGSTVYTDKQALHHETCNDGNCMSLYWDHLMFSHHVQNR